jgi:aminoglycoside N3'-acetyltransferase
MAVEAVEPEDLARSLTQLGVEAGQDLMVHASLRKLGPVTGGARGVLEAIRLALGPEGTLLMMIAANDDDPFDRLVTEADPELGVLAEVFRTHPGVEVNDNPACRLAAWGPGARGLLEPQPVHHYYGPGSPLERLYRRNGSVLRLGADIDSVTLTHYAEYRAALPTKRGVRRRYVRVDTGEIFIDSLDDDAGIAHWPEGDYFPQILLDFIAGGLARVGPVGRCAAELLDGRAFVDFATSWIEQHLA